MRPLRLLPLILAAPAAADPAHGLWLTAPSVEGRLEVRLGPCAADPALTCGVIERALGPEGPADDYPHLGRQMIFDMRPGPEGAYAEGRIWAPDDDRTYRARMALAGAALTVEGCVLIVCRGQDWERAD